MSDFKIKFRGVRGSYPTPKKNFLNFGGNTSCVEIQAGENLIILDCGYGIIDLGYDLSLRNKPANALILLSHTHMDHIQGLPFFKPIYDGSSNINIFGPAPGEKNLKEFLDLALFGSVFPLNLQDIKSNINVQNFSEEFIIILGQKGEIKLELAKNLNSIKLNYDDILISSYKNTSHPKEGSLAIKIRYKEKTVVYATDVESSDCDNNYIEFLRNADLLIHDAQYTSEEHKQGYGHSTFECAVENSNKAGAKELFFFHYDPSYDDEKLKSLEDKYQKLSSNYKFAKENLEIIL